MLFWEIISVVVIVSLVSRNLYDMLERVLPFYVTLFLYNRVLTSTFIMQ